MFARRRTPSSSRSTLRVTTSKPSCRSSFATMYACSHRCDSLCFTSRRYASLYLNRVRRTDLRNAPPPPHSLRPKRSISHVCCGSQIWTRMRMARSMSMSLCQSSTSCTSVDSAATARRYVPQLRLTLSLCPSPPQVPLRAPRTSPGHSKT